MKPYNKLFISKELYSIFGKGGRNFWILFFVFLLTIFALSFSRSGLHYLDYKMSDPFIHWIEVREQGDFQKYKENIDEIKSNFGISTIEANNYIIQYVFNSDFNKIRIEGRTIGHDSKLLYNILDKDSTGINNLDLEDDKKNIIVARDAQVSSTDYGWIVTKDLMTRLGYENENSYPLFLNYTFKGYEDNLNRLGITHYDEYFAIPIPIIAVVNQLPDLLDFIAPSYYMLQDKSTSKPFNISIHDNYFNELNLVIEQPDDNKEKHIRTSLDNAGVQYDDDWTNENFWQSLRDASKYRIIIRDTMAQNLNRAAEEICKDSTIHRTYNYDFDDGYKLRPNYISLMFADLAKVPEFVKWSKEEHGVRIDMAQIEAKDNFNLFNILSISLCVAIAIIAIAFISIFLYFLIDSHFRRISKNLGTIMAFGLSNFSIIKIYLVVFLGLILTSLSAVVLLLLCSEFVCTTLSFTREGGMPFFSINDTLVWGTIIILPIVSAIVTTCVLYNKLKATPGDLIFERNN